MGKKLGLVIAGIALLVVGALGGMKFAGDNRATVVGEASRYAQTTSAGALTRSVGGSGSGAVHDVRERVGRNPFLEVSFILIDLATGKARDIDTSTLPGLDSDPLRKLRAESIDWHIAQGADPDATRKALKAPDQRGRQEPSGRGLQNVSPRTGAAVRV